MTTRASDLSPAPANFPPAVWLALGLGAKGAVGSTYNFAAPLYRRMWTAFTAGDIRHGGQVNSYCDGPHKATGQFDFALAARSTN